MSKKAEKREQWNIVVLILVAVMLFFSDKNNIKAQEENRQEYISKLCDSILEQMTLEEKVAQLFFITPEALTGVSPVTAAGSLSEMCFSNYPVGGMIYFRQNIESRQQLSEMLAQMQNISKKRTGLPVFLATDEEGGSVTRIYGSPVENIPDIGSMYSIGSSGDPELAFEAGWKLGAYLLELNFNLNFAPVADVCTNPDNTVIGSRSFGEDVALVADMTANMVRGMENVGIKATLKHYPGHGNTSQDSHTGYASSYKSLDELMECELKPFQAGIEAGADFVMVGHISLPSILADETPASLSYLMISEILRKELQFDGIVITDALNMGAISQYYSSGEAAVGAIRAGVDMLLMPSDFQSAYEAVLNAVYGDEISEERIDESVKRIIRVKLTLDV